MEKHVTFDYSLASGFILDYEIKSMESALAARSEEHTSKLQSHLVISY